MFERPMMVCFGPWVPAPSPSSKSELPDDVRTQPVDTAEPTEYVPFEFIVSAVPLLESSVPVVAPLLREKNRSLIFCPTDLWFESKLLSVILIVPAPVRKVADAFTAFPPEEAPAAVKVVVFPNAAGPHNSTTQIRRNNLINLTPSYLAQSAPSVHRTSAGVDLSDHQ